MERVKLPREVAEAIDAYRDDAVLNNWKGAILKVALEPERYIKIGTDDSIKDYVTAQTLDSFLQALVNGYEVEQTPEERIREYVRTLEQKSQFTEREGALNVLLLLNIKIEGVNA